MINKAVSTLAKASAILLASLSLFSCNKKEPPVPVDPLIKKKFGFKPGSYWIFRDSISGRVDSCYLYSSDYRTSTVDKSVLYEYEILYIQLKQRPLDTTIPTSRFWSYSFSETNSLSCSVLAKDKGFDDLRYPFFFATYPLPGGLTYLSLQPQSYSQLENFVFLPDFSLSGHTYKSVTDVHLVDNFPGEYFKREVLLNDSVGFIKIALDHIDYNPSSRDTSRRIHEVWELQRSKVLK